MKLKTRIVSTVMSMALALGVMTFAVYAAATQTLSVTNTVSFVSDHVLAHVTGQVEGAKVWDGGDVNWTYGKVTTTPTVNLNELDNWEIGHIDFFDENAPINIFILIENYSLERMFTFELEFNMVNDPEDTNIDREVNYFNGYDAEYDLEDYIADYDLSSEDVVLQSYGSGTVEVQASTAKIIVVTLGIADTGLSVNSFDNGFSITLLNEGEATEQPGGGQTEGFVFDQQNKTITVQAGQTLTQANLPEMQVEGKEAFFGLFKQYSDEVYAQRIEYPFTPLTQQVLHAQFDNIPENIYLEDRQTHFAVLGGEPNEQGQLIVPEMVNGMPIKEIISGAFAYNEDLTNIILPNGLTTIFDEAFVSSGITSLELPSTVVEFMFTEAGSNFILDTPLYEGMPDGVIRVSHVALGYKGALEGIVTIPEGVKVIAPMAFLFTENVTEFKLPSTLEIICDSAFNGYASGTMNIPSTLNYIGSMAFYGNEWLKNAQDEYDTTHPNISIENNVVYLGNVAYDLVDREAVAVVLRPNTIGIASSAFEGAQFTQIALHDGLVSIGAHAFSMSSLQSINIPSSVKLIGEYAFLSNKTDVFINSLDIHFYSVSGNEYPFGSLFISFNGEGYVNVPNIHFHNSISEHQIINKFGHFFTATTFTVPVWYEENHSNIMFVIYNNPFEDNSYTITSTNAGEYLYAWIGEEPTNFDWVDQPVTLNPEAIPPEGWAIKDYEYQEPQYDFYAPNSSASHINYNSYQFQGE